MHYSWSLRRQYAVEIYRAGYIVAIARWNLFKLQRIIKSLSSIYFAFIVRSF